MTGFVDVGGGMRGIYTSGIYDGLLDSGIMAEYCIGVSAGSANLITYVAGQRGRTYKFYAEYASERSYMSLYNFRKIGSYIDLNYVYSGISNSTGKNPLDFKAASENSCRFKAVATDALTGKAHYFDKEDMKDDDYSVLKASCAIPMVCRPVEIGGAKYFDGGVADPIPFERAFADGCDRVVVFLTKPINELKKRPPEIINRLMRAYPKSAKAVMTMHERYNSGIAELEKLSEQGKALIVAPDDRCGVGTLTRNRTNLDSLYQKGYTDAQKVIEFMK